MGKLVNRCVVAALLMFCVSAGWVGWRVSNKQSLWPSFVQSTTGVAAASPNATAADSTPTRLDFEDFEAREHKRIRIVPKPDGLFIDKCHGTSLRICTVRFAGQKGLRWLRGEDLRATAYRVTQDPEPVKLPAVLIHAPRMLDRGPSEVHFLLPEGANLVIVRYPGAKPWEDFDYLLGLEVDLAAASSAIREH